jgi:hypothetical protein
MPAHAQAPQAKAGGDHSLSWKYGMVVLYLVCSRKSRGETFDLDMLVAFEKLDGEITLPIFRPAPR